MPAISRLDARPAEEELLWRLLTDVSVAFPYSYFEPRNSHDAEKRMKMVAKIAKESRRVNRFNTTYPLRSIGRKPLIKTVTPTF